MRVQHVCGPLLCIIIVKGNAALLARRASSTQRVVVSRGTSNKPPPPVRHVSNHGYWAEAVTCVFLPGTCLPYVLRQSQDTHNNTVHSITNCCCCTVVMWRTVKNGAALASVRLLFNSTASVFVFVPSLRDWSLIIGRCKTQDLGTLCLSLERSNIES